MARIKIEDLPVQRDMAAEETEAIVGGARFVPQFEALEERLVQTTTRPSWLPAPVAATLDPSNVLRVYGTAGDDNIKFLLNGGALSGVGTIYKVDASGNPLWYAGIPGFYRMTGSVPAAGIGKVVVDGGTGNDTIDLSAVSGPAEVYGQGHDWVAVNPANPANVQVFASNWAAATPYTVSVRHADGTTTNLLASRVTFTRQDGSQVIGRDGTAYLEPGTYTARVQGYDHYIDGSMQGFYDWTQTVVITDPHQANLVKLSQQVVDFQVLASHSGSSTSTPLANAQATFTRQSDGRLMYSCTADAAGRFHGQFSPGTYNVAVQSDRGLWTQALTITASTTTVTLQHQAVDLNVTVSHTASKDITPLANAQVTFTRPDGSIVAALSAGGFTVGAFSADSSGKLAVILDPGTYTATVQGGGFGWTQAVTVTSSTKGVLKLQHQVVDFQVNDNAAALPNAAVTISRLDGTPVGTFAPGANGQFGAILGSGDYRVTIHGGNSTWTQMLNLTSTPNKVLQLFAMQTVTVRLDTAAHKVAVDGTAGNDKVRVTETATKIQVFDDGRDTAHAIATIDKTKTEVDEVVIHCSDGNDTVDVSKTTTPTSVWADSGHASVVFFFNNQDNISTYGNCDYVDAKHYPPVATQATFNFHVSLNPGVANTAPNLAGAKVTFQRWVNGQKVGSPVVTYASNLGNFSATLPFGHYTIDVSGMNGTKPVEWADSRDFTGPSSSTVELQDPNPFDQ